MKVSSGDSLAALAATIEAEQAEASSTPAPASNVIAANAGPPVPAWVKPADLAAAEAVQNEQRAELEAHFEGPPAKPTDYRILPILGQGQIAAEEITSLRDAAHSIGVSVGEFENLQHVLQRIQPTPADARVHKKAADAMGAELERRYGDKRATEIAGYAVAAIKGAKGLNANVVAALRQEIVTNRPLLELLARIGERHAKRKLA